ncbi:hypothetical protein EYC95_00510 [Pseudomonas sp. BGI-2]|nr:hypothetical protein EYC95_00510 [Pseudomonas sp. BGI-2]
MNMRGTAQFVEAGLEIHYHAGDKVVVEAGMDLTARFLERGALILHHPHQLIQRTELKACWTRTQPIFP